MEKSAPQLDKRIRAGLGIERGAAAGQFGSGLRDILLRRASPGGLFCENSSPLSFSDRLFKRDIPTIGFAPKSGECRLLAAILQRNQKIQKNCL
jgi:hypothetical protein